MLHVRYAEAAARLPAAKFEPTQGEAHLASQAERTLQASSHDPPENTCRCDTESKGTPIINDILESPVLLECV